MTPSNDALAALQPRSDEPPARYALELTPGQDPNQVAAQVRERLADLDPTVRPISPTDHGVLVLDLGTRTLDGTDPVLAFSAGYALADDFGLRTAEPDLPTAFFPEEEPPAPGAAVEEAFRFPPGCWVDPEENLPVSWALDLLHVPEAWAFSENEGRPARGRGIVIAQPDTGVVMHAELADVVRFGAYDVLDDDPDPTDPLDGANPGHGTATASVVVSPLSLQVSGSAPEATHMPLRAVRSVVQISQVSVAGAIGLAVDQGAHVITMSLGGIPTAALQRAVQRAVAADVIVLAAAGNCVRSVVWPARYVDCLAVGGTNAADRMWKGSCRGPAVDISAPAQNVYKARVDAAAGPAGLTGVTQGQGTSFAVALTAGVAALWLAHHGRADLMAAAHAGGETLQDMFRRLVRSTARRPDGWNASELGAGIVDANALLRANLDLGRGLESLQTTEAVQMAESLTGAGAAVPGLVQEVAGPEAVPDATFDWIRYGPELATNLLRTRLAASGPGGEGGETVTPGLESLPAGGAVSEPLRGAISNPTLLEYLGLPDSSGPAGQGAVVLTDELRLQQELATRRVKERAEARFNNEANLREPEGLLRANDQARVVKRIDRVTSYMAGDNPIQAPADAPSVAPTTLVERSVERLADLATTPLATTPLGTTPLATTPLATTPLPDAAQVQAELEGLVSREGVAEPSEAAPSTGILLERIINTSDFMSVRYLDMGVVAEHAVGRVNIRDARGALIGYGTGFLVSPSLLLTNHHVLPDAATARTSIIEFNYQDGVDGKPLLSDVHPFAPDRFFVANRELDFALVAVDADPATLEVYGFCPLTAAQGTVIIGEAVTIVQHPRGEKKQITLQDNKLIDIPELVLHYAADTEPGSSGSPVFNDQWEVVALHHASVPTPEHAPQYSFLNEGIRISRILNFLAAAELPPEQRSLVDELRTSTPASVAKEAPRTGQAPVRPSGEVDSAQPEGVGTASDTAAPDATADRGVTIEVPLRITVQLGGPAQAIPGPVSAPALADPASADDQGQEAIAIDPDYANRGGYDAGFLGVPLPLPDVHAVSGVASEELKYHHFSIVMNRQRRLALFTAVNIDGRTADLGRRESDRWIIDPRLPRQEQSGEAVYRDNPLDRGHLVRRLDPAWGPLAKEANDDTFHFTNSTPQHHGFNAGTTLWFGLEDYVLRNADTHGLAVSVVSGPVLADDDPPYRGIALPRQFFKVVAMVTTAGKLSVTGYLLSQEALLDEFATSPEEFSFGAYRTFQVPVRRIADLTHLGLDPYVAGDPLERLESHSLPREIMRPGDIVLTL